MTVRKGAPARRCGEANVPMVSKMGSPEGLLDFVTIMADAERQGWSLVALDCPADASTPAGEAMVSVMAEFSQLERRLIGQRTREALAVKRAAKRRGPRGCRGARGEPYRRGPSGPGRSGMRTTTSQLGQSPPFLRRAENRRLAIQGSADTLSLSSDVAGPAARRLPRSSGTEPTSWVAALGPSASSWRSRPTASLLLPRHDGRIIKRIGQTFRSDSPRCSTRPATTTSSSDQAAGDAKAARQTTWARRSTGVHAPFADGSAPTPAEQTAAAPQQPEQLGRSAPCWCGNGKKFKKCHGA